LSNVFEHNLKIGVLGGGQLGRMLIQSAIDFNITLSVLDPDPHAPCAGISDFHCGAITDYDTVMVFGEACDLITIEIENVNTDALKALERAGKKVYPQPDIIALIQDKRTQKQFFRERGIPTADFVLTEDRAHVLSHAEFLPAVHKLGRAGYDGRGVQILRSRDDLQKSFDAPGVLEKLVDFTAEISVIVARRPNGEMVSYPAVEMAFHAEANLVEYLFSPAKLSADLLEKADGIARKVAQELGIVGLLAVEMFATKQGEILVNEIAPRPHNSGHHTIEANVTSQYEQLLRVILDLPAGDTSVVSPSAMVNLLGEPGHSGPARYMGFEEVLALPGAHIHLYGKRLTKPFRKMGHVTIVDSNQERLFEKVDFVKQKLKVIA
jgi:5-(carboxyamino)imidazole ribonucleotide synthase